MFTAREAASVKIVTMLDKPEGRTVEIEQTIHVLLFQMNLL